MCKCDQPCDYTATKMCPGQHAVQSGHPFNLCNGLTEVVKDAICSVVTNHPARVVLERKRNLEYWLNVAKEVQHLGNSLKQGAAEERLELLKPKRIQLLQRMIDETGYPAKLLAEDILKGFSLVGQIPKSHVLPKNFTPSRLLVSDLESSAKRSREAVRQSVRSSGDESVDSALWEKTITGVSKG